MFYLLPLGAKILPIPMGFYLLPRVPTHWTVSQQKEVSFSGLLQAKYFL